MSQISIKAVGDREELGQFTYNVDVVEAVRLVEAGTITRTIDCDLILVVASEKDDDSLYRVAVDQNLGDLAYNANDGTYSIDGVTGLQEGGLIYILSDSGYINIGEVASDGVTIEFNALKDDYDGYPAYLHYQAVSASLLMAVPVFSEKSVSVKNLSTNGHRVDVLFCRRET